ncbi:IS629 ORF2 [Limoniibacter endophyticus]|uniref:IS629 ORF2 n=1 Tax=Limoniibacter endophyticus TaxID=1565040 RepID=A0A8J3DGZ7_9HYPH|nr:IS629 ORF2 [Limoniibacter endophyticus]
MLREGFVVARCTVVADLGLHGVIRGKPIRTTVQDKAVPCPRDHVNRVFHAPSPEQALHDRRPANRGGLVHHSDRGSQYVSIRYTGRLGEAGIEPSVGSVGDSYDNALAETINGLYKAEVIHRRRPWQSFEAVEFATLTWIDWFNNRRLLDSIGNIPPAEVEERYYVMLEEQAVAA